MERLMLANLSTLTELLSHNCYQFKNLVDQSQLF